MLAAPGAPRSPATCVRRVATTSVLWWTAQQPAHRAHTAGPEDAQLRTHAGDRLPCQCGVDTAHSAWISRQRCGPAEPLSSAPEQATGADRQDRREPVNPGLRDVGPAASRQGSR